VEAAVATPDFRPEDVHPGRFWHRGDDGRFVCDLCPRACALRPGQRAFCYVRAANEEGIGLLTYGRSSGFCIDPIEKKPLHHFLPGTPVLSFGTAGCNLGCKFCQNWDISKARDNDRLASVATPESIALTARRNGCRSVAYTYNDPVLWAEYAIDTARECRALGVRNVAVTAGYITDAARAEFFELMDAANVDLKAFTEAFYVEQCLGHLQPVLDTLEYLVHHTSCWVEITTLLIPGLNDSSEEIDAATRWIAERLGTEVPLHFTAFHPDFKMLDRGYTPLATLRRAREVALRNGLRYVYTGNAVDPEGQSTRCPACAALLVERDGYEIGAYTLRGGACPECGERIAGVWEDRPGHWGARRRPIRFLER
jgi:pyruvate formate lyase activating enzyme